MILLLSFGVGLMGCSVNVMDFCKMFESVAHNILITESMLCNINKEEVKWIKKWLLSKLQSSVVNGQC